MVKQSSNKGAALVTGGARRVGQAIALALAEEGYDIALHYNSSESEAKKTKKIIEQKNVSCKIFKADISKIKECEKLVKAAVFEFKDLNVLVNNAAIFEKENFRETSEEFFDRHFALNFKAPFFITQNFVKNVKSGNIINILDSYITKKKTSYFAYLLSKKALHDFTLQAAAELGPNFQVNAVAPGIVLPSSKRDGAYIKDREKKLPLKETANVKDVTKAINFILQNKTTGQVIFTDGGENLL